MNRFGKNNLTIKEVIFQRDYFFVIILVAFYIYLIFWELGGSSLWDSDEPIYGELAKEMIKLSD